MKIIVIGAFGQIGREIVELANKKAIDVVGVGHKDVDITDKLSVEKLFKNNSHIDFVINSSAYTIVDKAEDEPEIAYAVNTFGVKNLAIECKKYNIPLLHLSTDYVFSGNKQQAYSEKDPVGPLNCYGASKLAGELLLKEILDKHIILRISWVFGRYGNNFVKTILKLAKEKETLQIVRDQVGGPTPAADIARVILEIIEHDVKHWGTYHYCGSPKVSWFEFAEKIIEISKKQQLPILVKQTNKIDCADYPTKAKRPKYSELCVDKIIHDFDIKQHKWEEYLPQVIQEIFNA